MKYEIHGVSTSSTIEWSLVDDLEGLIDTYNLSNVTHVFDV